MNPANPLAHPRRWLLLAAGVLLGHAVLLHGLGQGGQGPPEVPAAPVMSVRRLALPDAAPAAAAPPPAAAAPRAAMPAAGAARALASSPSALAVPQMPPQPEVASPVVEAAQAAEPAASQADALPAQANDTASAAQAGAAQAGAAASTPPTEASPVYATALPAPAELAYELRRGALAGTGVLRWQHADGRYQLALEGGVLGFTALEQHSQGLLDEHGLAPLRFADRRRGRDQRATNFQREAGKITFSSSNAELALARGAQDRLSWMVQLTAIAAAQPLPPGRQVAMQVAGLRGEADWWVFTVQPPDVSGLLHLVREPRRAYDTRVEVWLDPARGHWPARAVQTTQGSDARFELRRQDLEMPEPSRN